jgi:hypothetical protein
MAIAGRRTREESQVEDLAEESLFFFGEAQQLEKAVSGLQEAARIERLRLVAHVAETEHASLAAKEDLRRFEEIDEQRAGIHEEALELFKHARTAITVAARAAGVQHTRPDLALPGAIEGMVARRRVRREGASTPEVEAV